MIIRLTTLFAFLKPSMRRPSDPRRLVGRGQDAWANGRLWKTAGFLHAFPSDWRLSGHVDHRWLVWKINVYIASVVRDYDDIMTLLVCIQLCWKSWRSCVFACNESSKKNNAGRSDWPRVAIALGHGIRSDVDVYRRKLVYEWRCMSSFFPILKTYRKPKNLGVISISLNIMQYFEAFQAPKKTSWCGSISLRWCHDFMFSRRQTASTHWQLHLVVLRLHSYGVFGMLSLCCFGIGQEEDASGANFQIHAVTQQDALPQPDALPPLCWKCSRW